MIRIIACGKIKEDWLKEGIHSYIKRISSYEKIEVIEVMDEKAPESNSVKENEIVKEEEGKRLLKHIKEKDYVILLELKGQMLDSVSLSRKIEQLHTQGKSNIDFVIGGSLGVSNDVVQRANLLWKLSDCTFPHGLCRLILVEQIYRCYRILHHEPYHK